MSNVAIATAPENKEDLYEKKKKLLPPSHGWVDFQTKYPPKFLNIVKSFCYAFSGSVACYE